MNHFSKPKPATDQQPNNSANYQAIQNFLNKVDIVELIGTHVTLKKKGQNYVGLCPFHDDRNPSFYVVNSPQKKIFKCFSCNEGGNAITFVQKFRKTSFLEAIKQISAAQNIPLENNQLFSSKTMAALAAIEKLSDTNQIVAAAFHNQLLSKNNVANQTAYQYLANRQIALKTIETFQLGWSTNFGNFISQLFNLPHNEIQTANYLKSIGLMKENGSDVFYNMVMIPIHNKDNYLVGFAGRRIATSKHNTVKYLNTTETQFFKKSQLLFNYNRFLGLPNDAQKRLILVEGYMDVFALHEADQQNSCALMGVNLTDGNYNTASVINQLTKNNNLTEIILCLDNDQAGFQATQKIYQALVAANKWQILCCDWNNDKQITHQKDLDEIKSQFGVQKVKTIFAHDQNQENPYLLNFFAYWVRKAEKMCQTQQAKQQSFSALQRFCQTLPVSMKFLLSREAANEIISFYDLLGCQPEQLPDLLQNQKETAPPLENKALAGVLEHTWFPKKSLQYWDFDSKIVKTEAYPSNQWLKEIRIAIFYLFTLQELFCYFYEHYDVTNIVSKQFLPTNIPNHAAAVFLQPSELQTILDCGKNYYQIFKQPSSTPKVFDFIAYLEKALNKATLASFHHFCQDAQQQEKKPLAAKEKEKHVQNMIKIIERNFKGKQN